MSRTEMGVTRKPLRGNRVSQRSWCNRMQASRTGVRLVLQRWARSGSDRNSPGGSAPAVVQANEAFHLRLAALAGNQRVFDQLGLVLAFCRRLDTLCMRLDESWIPHDDLLDALERHDGARAQAAMAAHLGHSRDCLVRLFGQSPQAMK